MSRLPKNLGFIHAEEDKSLILRHNTVLINVYIIRLGIIKGEKNED